MLTYDDAIKYNFIEYKLKNFDKPAQDLFWKFLNLANENLNHSVIDYHTPSISLFYDSDVLTIRALRKKLSSSIIDKNLRKRTLSFEKLEKLYPEVEKKLKNKKTEVLKPAIWNVNKALKILETFNVSPDFLNKLKKLNIDQSLIFLAQQNAPVEELIEYYKALPEDETHDLDPNQFSRLDLLLFKAYNELLFSYREDYDRRDNIFLNENFIYDFLISDLNNSPSYFTGIRNKETLINLLYMFRFHNEEIDQLVYEIIDYYEFEEWLTLFTKIIKAIEENNLDNLLYSPLNHLNYYSKKELKLIPKTIPALKLVEDGEKIFYRLLEDFENPDGFSKTLMKNITINLLNLDEPYTWNPPFDYSPEL